MMELFHDNDFCLLSNELNRIFSSNFLVELAKKEMFMQREGKLKPSDFVSLCSFLNEDSGTRSLSQLCGILHSERKVSISTEGLNKRFNTSAVEMLKKLFNVLLETRILSRIPSIYGMYFKRIRIVDSTGFELPEEYADKYKGSFYKSMLKVQLEYELLSGNFLHFQVQEGKEPDTTFGGSILNSIQRNDLIIRDLGYFALDDFEEIEKRGAFFITRLKPEVCLYRIESKEWVKFDLEEVMEEMEDGETREIRDIYVGTKKKLPVPRLILYKMTEEQTARRLQRRKKQEKKKGVKYTPKTKKLTKMNMFLTNIPSERVGNLDIHLLYSLRWQIEILFKTWKSLFKINQIKKMKIERFECHLYGTLISLFICSTLVFQMRNYLLRKRKKEASEYKACALIMASLPALHRALFSKTEPLLSVIWRIFDQIDRNGKKSHKGSKMTLFDILVVAY